jgi:hypothetical protein
MAARNVLSQFTTDQLLEEVVRRRNERKDVGDVEPCDECRHFVFWTAAGDVPKDYNPCNQGKRMNFHMPGDGEDPHSSIGYYRRVCASRLPREGGR